MQNITATVTFEREVAEDNDPDTSYLAQDYADVPDAAERAKYKAQDAERLAAFKRGDWHYIGIRAKAVIIIRDALNRCSWRHELTSNGLWGIESDAGEDYLSEVFAEECAQLRADIAAMGAAEFN